MHKTLDRSSEGGSPVSVDEAHAASPPAQRGPWQLWLVVSLVVILLDFATKHAILAAFRPGEEKPLLPFFSLVLAFNPGAAFSFLAGADGWQRWVFATIAVVASFVVVWLLRKGGSTIYCLGLALIMGGALMPRGGARRRRGGCWCTGRRSWDALRRGRRRRASASSGRT